MRYVLTGDQLRTLLKRIGILEFLHDLIAYDLAFNPMIKAGHYDWVDPNITVTNFPGQRTDSAKYEPVLVHLGRKVSTKEAKDEIRRLGLVPASLSELCAFGVNYPDEQKKYPIVALGRGLSLCGYLRFPCLCSVNNERDLRLLHDVDGWDVGCRFLAFRNRI